MTDEALARITQLVGEGEVFQALPRESQDAIRALSRAELEAGLRRVTTRPIPGEVSQGSRLLLNPCLAAQWASVFEALALPRNLHVYEPCTGSSEPVLLATQIHSGGAGSYVSVNLNQPLAAELHAKIQKLTIAIRLIEDDAAAADLSQMSGSFDVACFHHALNDLLQTAVAEDHGWDTRQLDWWAAERQMIEWLAEEAAAGRLEGRPKQAVVGAVRNAIELLKPGGVLLCDHWTWEAYRHVPWFPWELFQQLIPLARRWIHEEGLPVEEIPFPEADQQWWFAFRKKL